jgi:predicted transcriptional regulator
MQRTTVRLPDDLLDRARRKAAAEGRTLTSLIEDGLRAIVSENPKAAKRKRGMPRVSEAGGGLMPGVDLTNPSTLQEADDLDYVRRLGDLE